MNIRINTLCLLLAVATSTDFSASQQSFFLQGESTQHFVLEKNKEFRLFNHNCVIIGEGAKWDQKEKLTDTPCFWIEDISDKSAGTFRQHNPIWIAPCTEYELSYMVKIDKLEGAGPFVEFILFDYNTDLVNTLRYPVGVDREAGVWIERKIKLKTDYLTHELIIQLSSDVKGKCNVYFDKVYFKQISESGSLMPTPVNLIENEFTYIAQENGNEKIFNKCSLPITRNFLKLSFDISWDNYYGNTFLYIDWIDEYGKVIGKDYCDIYRIEGVKSDGIGIATRWKRGYGKKSDKASFKLDWHFNSDEAKGQSRVERTMKVPPDARYAQIRVVRNDDCKGKLQFDKLALTAEY